MKKYTFNEWWDGIICLSTSPVFHKKEVKNLNRVSWNEILENDISKIKEKQLELFNENVTERLHILKTYFLEKYENSKMQTIFLEDEIGKVNNLMFGIFPLQEQIILWDYDGLVFNNFNLANIQQYIDRYLKKGEEMNYDFMHSPRFPHQKDEIPCEIYGECLWQYFNWLTTFREKINTSEISEVEPENPFPEIFRNGYAYQMYKDLVSYTVNKGTETADFAFIFHKLSNRALKAIHKSVSQSSFIDFVNKGDKYTINNNKLNHKDQKNKQAAFTTILEKYKDKILGSTI